MHLSVVIPFFNELSLVGNAVASIFTQSDLPRDFEIEACIGNDGPNGNAEVMAAIDPKYRAHVLIDANRHGKGPGGARNTAIDLGCGELIAFLDADDVWLPEKLALQLRAIELGATFVATGYRFQGRNVRISPPKRVNRPLDVFWRQGIGTSTVLLRRTLMGESRFSNMRFAQDIDFWYRLAQKPQFEYARVAQPCALYSTGGSTKNKLEQAKCYWQVMRSNQVLLHHRLAVLTRYAVRGVVNHYLS